MTPTPGTLLRAIPLVAVTLAPEIARASNISCDGNYDPCELAVGWLDISLVSTGKIPIDGVLVLQGAFPGDPPGLQSVALSVSTGDMPVTGTLEKTEVPGTLVWRPDAPWAAGATYLISGSATNNDDPCLPIDLPIHGEVTIDTLPAPELNAASLSGVELENFMPTISLETLACCVGVGPFASPAECGIPGDVNYDPANCTPTEGIGSFDLSLSAAPVPTGPVAQQVAYRLNVDIQKNLGQRALTPMFDLTALTTPVCVSVDLINLASKAVVPGPQKCFGEGLVAKLGAQKIDPAATLDCPFQTCPPNTDYDGWDIECTIPVSPTTGPTDAGGDDSGDSSGGDSGGEGGEDGDKACACDASRRPGADLLLTIGALGLTRRRRLRPSIRQAHPVGART